MFPCKAQLELEAKEAINFMETQYSLRNIQYNLRNIQYNLRNLSPTINFVSNHKSTTSKQLRRMKFDMVLLQ